MGPGRENQCTISLSQLRIKTESVRIAFSGQTTGLRGLSWLFGGGKVQRVGQNWTP